MTKVRVSQLAKSDALTGDLLTWNGYEWAPAAAPEDTRKVNKALYNAKGAILAASSANTPATVTVGANNTVLTADSTQTTGVKWAPANDETKVPLTLYDAKGDLLVGAADNSAIRLAAGLAGEVLSVDGATTTGLRWRPIPVPTAAQVPFVPYGIILSTNVQAAIEELSVKGGGGGTTSGGHTIQDEGVALTQRAGLNFVGAGVVVTDDSANNRTMVSISGANQTILPARTTASVTTAALETNAYATALLTLAPGYRLLRLATDRASRVRVYDSTSSQTADLNRQPGTDPDAGSGVVLDYVTKIGALNVPLSPLVDGYVASGSDAAVTVTNLGAAGTVTVTFTYVRTE